MINLYTNKKKEWEKHYNNFDFYSRIVFDLSIDDLIKIKNPNIAQEKIIEKFKKYSPVIIGADGVMDKISRKMISSISEIKTDTKECEFDYSIYKSGNNSNEDRILKEQIRRYLKIYNRMRKDFYLSSKEHDNMNSIFTFIKNELFSLCSDISKLTDNALDLCYGEMRSNYDFIWNIFLEGILYNMEKRYKKYKIPFFNEDGDIEFLNRRYSILEVSVGQEEG